MNQLILFQKFNVCVGSDLVLKSDNRFKSSRIPLKTRGYKGLYHLHGFLHKTGISVIQNLVLLNNFKDYCQNEKYGLTPILGQQTQ